MLLADREEEAAQHDLRRGGQADEGRARRGAARRLHLRDGGRRVPARRPARRSPWTPRPPASARSRSRCASPIGVVGAISPFNFPLNLVAHKIAPALAAGCAVVLKPAGQTPLSALLARRARDGGRACRPGWLNVLVGKASEIGDVLVSDERVKMITFTGSSGVGWELRERAAQKKVTLELGNTTPVIVEADADIEEAAAKLAANAFAFAGQSCISVQRIYVQPRRVRRLRRPLRPEGRGARRRRSVRRRHRRRPGDRRRREGADRRLDRRGRRPGRDAARRRRGGRAPAPDRARGRDAPR